jgi:urease accessory protein
MLQQTTSQSLALLLSETALPEAEPVHSGGIEAACASGIVHDAATLEAFLCGRLRTSGTVAAHAAAAVCARASSSDVPATLWRAIEAELDARIFSPAARLASRQQGGRLLHLALALSAAEVLWALSKSTIPDGQEPHHAVVIGALAAAADASPAQAASSAALAAVAGAAFAAAGLLHLGAEQLSEVGAQIASEVRAIAARSAREAWQPLARIPSFAAPALEYLAEQHAEGTEHSFAS